MTPTSRKSPPTICSEIALPFSTFRLTAHFTSTSSRASVEAYGFGDLESERVDFDGLEVSVVTPETLYRMKKSTVRPQIGETQSACARASDSRTNDAGQKISRRERDGRQYLARSVATRDYLSPSGRSGSWRPAPRDRAFRPECTSTNPSSSPIGSNKHGIRPTSRRFTRDDESGQRAVGSIRFEPSRVTSDNCRYGRARSDCRFRAENCRSIGGAASPASVSISQ